MLVEENLGLVWKAVHHFKGKGMDDDDLFQTGCLGLVKAAKRFESDRGLQFSTYAFPTIVGEIKTALRDNSSIRVSRSIKTLAMHAKKEEEVLQNKLGRKVGVDELARHMNCDRTELVAAFSAVAVTTEMVSFDSSSETNSEEKKGNGSGNFAAEKVVADMESEEDWVTTIDFKNRISALDEKEKRIFELRFIVGTNQVRTAEILGMSQAQVSRLEKQILLKVRKSLAG